MGNNSQRKGLYQLNEEGIEKQEARFEKCIGCPDMGVRCSGPNLSLLPIAELRIWVRKWKEHFGLSVEACGEIWNIGGSAKRFLGGQDTGFQYTTVQSIVQGVVSYGLPPETVASTEPCPSTSAEISERVCRCEKELKEAQDERESLLARKNAHATEFIERMTELRTNYEKRLTEKQDTIDFLKELAEKRQRDLEKQEAVTADYLTRIDTKNARISELVAELLRVNQDSIQQTNAHAQDMQKLTAQILDLVGLIKKEG